MTLAGRDAVRKAFKNTSGMDWECLRSEFISIRLEMFYRPFNVEDIDAGSLALELVGRAYLQGLREADQIAGEGRTVRAERERRADTYTSRLMDMFDSKVNADWVSAQERDYVRNSVRVAYLAGCDEGRLPIGSVI